MKKQKWIAWAMAAMLTVLVPMQVAAAVPKQADAGKEVTIYSDKSGKEDPEPAAAVFSVTNGDAVSPDDGKDSSSAPNDSTGSAAEEKPDDSTGSAEEEKPDDSTGPAAEEKPDDSTGSAAEEKPDDSTGSAAEEEPGVPEYGTDSVGGEVSGGETASVTGGDADGSVSGGDWETSDLSGKVVNLAFVIDTTGSMAGYIQGVIDNLKDFVKYIEGTKVTFRLSLIEYRDITEGEETIVHTFDHSVWSKSTEEFSKELSLLEAMGGGDSDETLVDALGYLVDDSVMTFNSSAAKFAVVLTDASFKTDNTHGIASMDELTASLSARGIRVSVMTPEWYFPNYEKLTETTGGILCPVNDFALALKKYANEIIRATADSTIDEDHQAVKSIHVKGPSELQPNYVYSYQVSFEPENADDKGVYWYVEDTEIAQIISARGELCYVRGIKEGATKLTAVSRDGGYTSEVNMKILADAGTDDAVISYDMDGIRALLGNDSLKKLEYRITGGKEVTADEQKEIFTSLKGKDKTFSFTFVDGEEAIQYKWSFQGTDILDESVDMSFGIDIGKTEAGVVGDLGDSGKQLGLQFGHEGGLPGRATVTTAVGDYFTTDQLYLYYFNPVTKSFELAAETVPVRDGYATFPLAHCSDYILTSEMLRSLVPVNQLQNNSNDDDKDDGEEKPAATAKAEIRSPKTGEPDHVMIYVFMCSSFAGLVWCGIHLKGKRK